jgi:outer membrane protein TolC
MNRTAAIVLATFAARVWFASTASADSEPIGSIQELREALRRYTHEPTVVQVVMAALENPAIDPGEVARAATRARAAGWLPDIQLRARRGRGQDYYATQSTTSDRTNFSTGDDMFIEAGLTFHLDRLLASGMEVGFLREERNHWAARRELVGSIIRLYFERRRLQLQRDLFRRSSLEDALRIQEIEAQLEVFTTGKFSRMMMHRAVN